MFIATSPKGITDVEPRYINIIGEIAFNIHTIIRDESTVDTFLKDLWDARSGLAGLCFF